VPWILRDDEVLASAEVAATAGERRRGLLGRDGLEGALVLQPCHQVHTFGMRFPIDVIWCDRECRVLRVATMTPWRVSRFVWRARLVIEMSEGAASRWGIEAGDQLELRATSTEGR
jgi:uncharacterized protein